MRRMVLLRWGVGEVGAGNASGGAAGGARFGSGLTEDSAVVAAVEIQATQTAKEAAGSDSLADSVSDADATNAAGTTVEEAPKWLKQIFWKGPNFAAIEKSGQNQGRVQFPFEF